MCIAVAKRSPKVHLCRVSRFTRLWSTANRRRPCPICSRQCRVGRLSVHGMDIRLTSTVFQVFAHDLGRSLDFYRLLGLPVPDAEDRTWRSSCPAATPLSFDIEETIAGMHPGWAPPSSPDSRLALALGVGFACRGRRAVREGHRGRSCRTVEALRRAVGSALRDRRRPRRQLGGSVRAAGVLTQRRQRDAGQLARPRGAGAVGRRSRRGRPPRRREVRRPAAAVRAGSAGCGAASPGRSRRRRCTAAAGCVATSRPRSATSATVEPAARPSVTWLSSGSDHGAVSARGPSDSQLRRQLCQRTRPGRYRPQIDERHPLVAHLATRVHRATGGVRRAGIASPRTVLRRGG